MIGQGEILIREISAKHPSIRPSIMLVALLITAVSCYVVWKVIRIRQRPISVLEKVGGPVKEHWLLGMEKHVLLVDCSEKMLICVGRQLP